MLIASRVKSLVYQMTARVRKSKAAGQELGPPDSAVSAVTGRRYSYSLSSALRHSRPIGMRLAASASFVISMFSANG